MAIKQNMMGKRVTVPVQKNLNWMDCKSALTLQDDRKARAGFVHKLSLRCCKCNWIKRFFTSALVQKDHSEPSTGRTRFDLNVRSVLAFREIGKGHDGMQTLATFMNLFPPVSKSSYHAIKRSVHLALTKTAVESCQNAARETKESLSFKDDDGPQDCQVSVDGSLQKRGHISLNGVVTLILEKMESVWITLSCQKNAKAVNSGKQGQMILDMLLGDGDSSSYGDVASSQPYGEGIQIEKKECIGHAGRALELSESQAKEVEHEQPERATNAIRSSKGSSTPRRGSHNRQSSHNMPNNDQSKQCGLCGGKYPHNDGPCKAMGKTCNSCGKLNHFAKVCRSKPPLKQNVRAVTQGQENVTENNKEVEGYLFTIRDPKEGKRSPMCEIDIDETKVKVMIDSGSTVIIIDEATFERINNASRKHLQPTNHRIYAYGTKTPLPLAGTFEATFESNNRIKVNTVNGNGNHGNLLGLDTALELGVLQLVNQTVSMKSPETCISDEYQCLFEGIGKVKDKPQAHGGRRCQMQYGYEKTVTRNSSHFKAINSETVPTTAKGDSHELLDHEDKDARDTQSSETTRPARNRKQPSCEPEPEKEISGKLPPTKKKVISIRKKKKSVSSKMGGDEKKSGRGVGTIIKRAAPVMKRILKLIAPKLGKAAMRVALPVIKEHGEKALKRVAAGENVKKVTKETTKSFLQGIKRKAADEVVNVMNKDVLNDVKKQATEEL
eukprot:gene11518-12709_t